MKAYQVIFPLAPIDPMRNAYQAQQGIGQQSALGMYENAHKVVIAENIADAASKAPTAITIQQIGEIYEGEKK